MPGNREKAGKKNRTSFKPGQSGNPSGRPKIPEEFKELAKKYSVTALKKVIEIMENEEADNRDQLRASEIIMDRAWGKSTQSMDVVASVAVQIVDDVE
jgi:hypothetical protein